MYLLAQFVKKGKQINQHSIFMDSIYFIAGINSEFSAEARGVAGVTFIGINGHTLPKH